jgi:hypothetical protein
MTRSALSKIRSWRPVVLSFVVGVSALIIVCAEFLRGSELYGALLGLVILGGMIDWSYRVRSDPAAGFDPLVVMCLALLLATPRFGPVAAWLGLDG